MSRRLRRLPILLLPLVLVTALSACGSDDASSSDGSSSPSASAGDLHGITITGDVGEEPKVEWDGELDVDKTETSVVTEGDGDTVADGDQVQAHLWIGNGTTQKKAYSTYDDGKPETVTASDQLARSSRTRSWVRRSAPASRSPRPPTRPSARPATRSSASATRTPS